MYVALSVLAHALAGMAAAIFIAPRSLQPAATTAVLADLSMVSALIAGIGLGATAKYLSKRIRPVTGLLVGLACGLLCCVTTGLAIAGLDLSLIIYLTILAPTLLAVLLASLLDRSRSGWQ